MLKNTLLLATLSASLFVSSQAHAQAPVAGKLLPKFTVGIKAGVNFQTLTGDAWANTYKPGVLAGAFVGVYKGHWGVQAEGLIKTTTFDNTFTYTNALGSPIGSGSQHFNAVWLDVPLLAEYKIVKRVWIQAGPQFSAMLSAKLNGQDAKSTFKTTDFAGVVGVEVKLPLHLTAGVRYVLGFSDINNSGLPDTWKNRYAQLYVGFRFL